MDLLEDIIYIVYIPPTEFSEDTDYDIKTRCTIPGFCNQINRLEIRIMDILKYGRIENKRNNEEVNNKVTKKIKLLKSRRCIR